MLLGASTPCFVPSPNVPATDNISEDKRAAPYLKELWDPEFVGGWISCVIGSLLVR